MGEPSGKYIACLDDAENIVFWGTGDTPKNAARDFERSGELHDAAWYFGTAPGDAEILIYTWVKPEDSLYGPEEVDPDWSFVLDEKVATIKISELEDSSGG